MKNYKESTIKELKHGKYIVTFIHTEECEEAWLRHENYGVAMLMYGVVGNIGEKQLIALLPSYIATYKEQYED